MGGNGVGEDASGFSEATTVEGRRERRLRVKGKSGGGDDGGDGGGGGRR